MRQQQHAIGREKRTCYHSPRWKSKRSRARSAPNASA